MYDVCASILFAQMADVIAETPRKQRPEWLTALKQQLRVHALLGADQYVALGEWCDGHEEGFLAVLAEAARRLAARGRITAQEAAAWAVCDGQPIIWRGPARPRTPRPPLPSPRPSTRSSTDSTPSRRRDTAGTSAARRFPRSAASRHGTQAKWQRARRSRRPASPAPRQCGQDGRVHWLSRAMANDRNFARGQRAAKSSKHSGSWPRRKPVARQLELGSGPCIAFRMGTGSPPFCYWQE